MGQCIDLEMAMRYAQEKKFETSTEYISECLKIHRQQLTPFSMGCSGGIYLYNKTKELERDADNLRATINYLKAKELNLHDWLDQIVVRIQQE
ncbi:hypothetical protein WR25_19572 [Diploscapter pachys]|uniref:Uncharacterized protein n=1 Tax=Diploscapter pachys TaxID=2018661 RepID=A0A2A2KQ50_9BILA|nr:hypothetical protein WR25_19572 [Diploscapter pachys]